MSKIREEGSIGIVLIACTTALSLAALYAKQSAQQSKDAVTRISLQNTSSSIELNNLTNLSLMRGLVNTTKVDNGVYQPAIFASNYFDSNWNLQSNKNITLKDVTPKNGSLTIKSFAAEPLNLDQAAKTFGASNSRNVIDAMSQNRTMEIIRLNSDIENGQPYYIKSMDVRIKTKAQVPGSNSSKEITSIGRIGLEAPMPSNLKFLVKAPGSATFVEDFGSKDSPLPPGAYVFRIVASGVVHHANISFNGTNIVLGFDANGITHKANNVLASDVVIGDTEAIPMTTKNAVTQSVAVTGCHFSVSNDINSGIAPNSIEIKADVVGVDGHRTTISTTKILYTLPYVTPPAEGGWACEDRCPTRTWEDVLASDKAFQHYLDISATSPTDHRLTDYKEWDKSVEVHNHGGVGAVCTNFELVAQAIASGTGMKPSDAAAYKPDEYTAVKDQNMGLKRDFAYMAPACERQLVGYRTACGCFEENSLIRMADGSERKASLVRAGDMLWNPKTGKAQEVKRVIAGPEKWPLFRVVASDLSVDVTGEHPFLTTKGLMPAYHLKEGDIIINEGKEFPISSVAPIERAAGTKDPDVWNFELIGDDNPDEHYVLANGIMTGDLYLQIKLKGGSAPEGRSLITE